MTDAATATSMGHGGPSATADSAARSPHIPVAIRRLLETAAPGKVPRLVVRTQSRVDTGGWWGRPRIWLFAFETSVLLLAAGSRPLVLELPCAQLRQSLYNHVTSSLVLAPAPGAAIRSLQVEPAAAVDLLQVIRKAPAGGTPPEPDSEGNVNV